MFEGGNSFEMRFMGKEKWAAGFRHPGIGRAVPESGAFYRKSDARVIPPPAGV